MSIPNHPIDSKSRVDHFIDLALHAGSYAVVKTLIPGKYSFLTLQRVCIGASIGLVTSITQKGIYVITKKPTFTRFHHVAIAIATIGSIFFATFILPVPMTFLFGRVTVECLRDSPFFFFLGAIITEVVLKKFTDYLLHTGREYKRASRKD